MRRPRQLLSVLSSILAAIFAALPLGAAHAASWLEMNFSSLRPALRGRAATLRLSRCARQDFIAVQGQGKHVLDH